MNCILAWVCFDSSTLLCLTSSMSNFIYALLLLCFITDSLMLHIRFHFTDSFTGMIDGGTTFNLNYVGMWLWHSYWMLIDCNEVPMLTKIINWCVLYQPRLFQRNKKMANIWYFKYVLDTFNLFDWSEKKKCLQFNDVYRVDVSHFISTKI